MNLGKDLKQFSLKLQGELFPILEEELGRLPAKLWKLIQILELIEIERYVPKRYWVLGRPPADRVVLAKAFVAKMVYNFVTSRDLMDRLSVDRRLRRVCGWERVSQLPSESTFSRAFAEFSQNDLAQRAHEALIKTSYKEQLVGHISRDSTKIESREKPIAKKTEAKKPKKRGRPRKGESRESSQESRLVRQSGMSLSEMLENLPTACDVGLKKNSKGNTEKWIGYKLHLDVADGQIPISGILSSASLHDSQAAIPLSLMSSQRVTNCYDLMDAAYDADQIKKYSVELGHIPIIDTNPRSNKELSEALKQEARRRKKVGICFAQDERYKERSTAERVNGRFKDEFGGRHIRVKGHAKVACHVMFGILALTADQLLRMAA